PEGPTITATPPGGTDKETPLRTSVVPKDFRTLVISTCPRVAGLSVVAGLSLKAGCAAVGLAEASAGASACVSSAAWAAVVVSLRAARMLIGFPWSVRLQRGWRRTCGP